MSGILDIPAADYHSDNIVDTPTLSRSIAHLLVTASPRHAWAAHPRLNPAWAPEPDPSTFEIGTAAHDLFLRGIDTMDVFDYKDWRTNEAKEARYQSRVQGRIPLLTKHADSVREMVDTLVRQIGEHSANPPLFTDGKPEQTITWEENGVLCRARLDWLRDDFRALDDLKTTARMGGAHPDTFGRNLYGHGLDIQAAFYKRGVRAITGVDPDWRFAVIESEPPYAFSVISLKPEVLAIAEAKVEYAINLWRTCLERDEWPGYPNRTCWVDLPPWEEARWLDKMALAELAA